MTVPPIDSQINGNALIQVTGNDERGFVRAQRFPTNTLQHGFVRCFWQGRLHCYFRELEADVSFGWRENERKYSAKPVCVITWLSKRDGSHVRIVDGKSFLAKPFCAWKTCILPLLSNACRLNTGMEEGMGYCSLNFWLWGTAYPASDKNFGFRVSIKSTWCWLFSSFSFIYNYKQGNIVQNYLITKTYKQ